LPANEEKPIRDTGIGISGDRLPHIFDRFYRCDPIRSKSGNGPGLSLVQAMVKSYGGRLTVDSRPGRVSTFTVTLPNAA
jgi:signal transduction histidine kinase